MALLCWKIVRPDMTSFIATPPFRVQYRIGEWAEAPEGTGLLCFETLLHAAEFIWSDVILESGLVLLCEAGAVVSLPRFGCLQDPMKSWRREMDDVHPGALSWGRPWPVGTVAYKRVKPLREVLATEELYDLARQGAISSMRTR